MVQKFMMKISNEYIDYICSWGPLILGHNHPLVLNAVQEIIENGSSYGLPTKYEVELAELIVSIIPSIEKIRLTTYLVQKLQCLL